MRKALLFVCIVMSVASAYAQKVSSPHLVLSLNGGLGIPAGNYGKSDYDDQKSGFWKTGVHINISAVYYLDKNWGIGILGGYSQFGLSAQSLADGYKEDSGTDSTTLYKKGNNRNISVLAGPYYRLPVGKKVSVDFRILGGYINTHLASGGAFGFQAGAGVTYHITDKIGIKANADYFSSKPKINISYDNFIVNSGRRLNTYNESSGGINATLGVAFSLP